jgi:two-component system, NarL family, sensor histidine kinase DesK
VNGPLRLASWARTLHVGVPYSMSDGVEGDDTRAFARGWNGWLGVFYAGIWLVYLLQPLQEAWGRRGSVRGQVGIAATLLFAVAYLLHFLASRGIWAQRHALRGTPLGPRLGRYAVLIALAVVSTVALGQSATAAWVFVAVAGLWTVSMPVALVIGVGIVVLYEALSWNLTGWRHDQSVVLAIALALAAVAGGMVASSRQRALGQARQENARLAVQEERNRMARDLHDILGHSLTVITVKAELAGRLMDVAPERAKAEVADLERLSRDALADVRRAVQGYREISLSGELARARESLGAAGIVAVLPNATDEVPSDLRELYAWVVREGVTNVIRHSRARRCTISLSGTGITIADDGVGPVGGRHDGNGLNGLRERATAVGALVLTRVPEPHGFELGVTTPSTAQPPPGDGPTRTAARVLLPSRQPRTP